MNKILFKEEQRYAHPWIWLFIMPAIGAGLLLFAMIKENGNLRPKDDNELTGLIIAGGFVLLLMAILTWLFYTMKLVIIITRTGIKFRYPPFINKPRRIKASEIKGFTIRDYQPYKEYGGHGIKIKYRKKVRAYTVSGRKGLEITLRNGEKIMFGTRRKEALRHAMDKMINSE